MAAFNPPLQEGLDPSLGGVEACGKESYYLMQETKVCS